jgi:hypothetical protein
MQQATSVFLCVMIVIAIAYHCIISPKQRRQNAPPRRMHRLSPRAVFVWTLVVHVVGIAICAILIEFTPVWVAWCIVWAVVLATLVAIDMSLTLARIQIHPAAAEGIGAQRCYPMKDFHKIEKRKS